MRGRSVEQELADLARRQHRVVARRQRLRLGLQGNAVDRRLEAGRVHRIHAGVYAVGRPILGVNGQWMAAVLAAGGARRWATLRRPRSGTCAGGIRVATPARTILDYAAIATDRELA
jgi:hypothetical protein